MSNYVLKYSRGQRVKYISHLDFIRTFHRAVRRSGLTMSYSQGFNPHPIMNIALPLSVGVTSDGEYMRLGLEGELTNQEIIDRLNYSLPKGFQILDVVKVENKEMNFSKIDRADYIVEVELVQNVDINIEQFLSNEEIIVLKKTKSGEKEADIKSHIHQLSIEKIEGNVFTFSMCLSAGSVYNLKPDTVISAMEKYITGFQSSFVWVHRVRMLAGDICYL